MTLETTLQELVEQVPDAIGAILVDWEGEAVVEYCHCPSYQMRVTGAHLGIVLSQTREMVSAPVSGTPQDIVLTTASSRLIIAAASDDYALVLQTGRDCPAALALRQVHQAVNLLKKEL